MQIAIRELGHYVDGADVPGGSGRFGDVYEPATGEVQARVAFPPPAELDNAVAVARRAFGGWSQTPPARRAAVLFAYRELLRAHTDRLALMITREHGKTLDDARGEVQRGLAGGAF